jgi:hypothetical protein
MKVELFNIDEFIKINHLQEVTSPVLFERGGIPATGGLISNEIFGLNSRTRKITYAYIDLHGHFFHPHIYKAMCRFFPKVREIIQGVAFYSIEKSTGYLIKDDVNGETGIEFLYENWDKIKFRTDDNPNTQRNERIGLIKGYPRDVVFISKYLVIPAFYRDIKSGDSGRNEQDDINKYYATLIRQGNVLKERNMFAFQYHNTNYNIQTTLEKIYEYFRDKLSGKTGLLKRYLLGKNVDYCTRAVITAEVFHADKPEECEISYEYASVAMSHVLSLCTPFIKKYVLDFFQREVFDVKNGKILYDAEKDNVTGTMEIINPESVFTDKYITKMIDTYIKDPESRFDKIEIPVEGNKKRYLIFTGTRFSGAEPTAANSTIVNRPMCWTDLLFMACRDTVKDKHILITRYPILSAYGTFMCKIKVASTTETEPMIINGEIIKDYPKVDYTIPKLDIGSHFIDSIRFSNSYLKGIDGDLSATWSP